MFAEATNEGRQFNKLVVFDEAHKYIDSPIGVHLRYAIQPL
jgi:DNA phosphorothioation-dependent restriction protein DptH